MENKTGAFNFSVKGTLDIIFRHKIIMLVTFAVIVFFTLIGLQFVTKVYDANVKMLIRGQSVTAAETYIPIAAYGIHMTQAEIVKSYPVLKRAAIALNLQNRPLNYEKNYSSKLKRLYVDYMAAKAEKNFKKFTTEQQDQLRLDSAIEDLRKRLSVNMLPGTDIFIINVVALSPEEAIETANVISRSYTIFDQLQQLAEISLRYGESHPTVVQLKDNIRYATENLTGKPLPDIEAIGTASVKVIEQATSTGQPLGRPKKLILLAALFIAGFAGFGIAFVYGTFDRTIKSPQEIAEFLNIPCIGSIPKKQKKENFLINEQSPLTRYVEFYEDLAEQLYVFLKTQGLKSAVITSPVFDENHQYIVPNIGYFLTQYMGHSTLLVDANFNKPHFQKIYPIEKGKIITSKTNPNNISNAINKIEAGPDIIPTDIFSDNQLAVMKQIDLKSIINHVKSGYDVILIDATSVNNTKEASFTSECSDGIVIVIDEGRIQREMLRNSLPRLRRNDVKILGSILNNRSFPIPEIVYKRFRYFID